MMKKYLDEIIQTLIIVAMTLMFNMGVYCANMNWNDYLSYVKTYPFDTLMGPVLFAVVIWLPVIWRKYVTSK